MPLVPDRGYGQDQERSSEGIGGVRTDSRVGRQLRRELVHRLASAPCTHSELQDSCNSSYSSETVDSDVRLQEFACTCRLYFCFSFTLCTIVTEPVVHSMVHLSDFHALCTFFLFFFFMWEKCFDSFFCFSFCDHA